ncbi:hypothetical protein [Saccharomonospora piscinae]|uniref:hypothetical protein n=1 Tax=Saccharomonospora piscinae TaxID=687388 RepID=UPI0011073201|nr:hypothetical protein [Saccharomonospora piscinae]TLW91581.1 hypothetical protein FFT09_11555 [Saccharomonospora piscinae]
MRSLRPFSRRARREYRDDVDRAFGRVERITAVGGLIGTLEQLTTARSMSDRGLLAWPVARTRLRGFNGRAGSVLNALVAYPNVKLTLAARATAAAGLLLGARSRRGRASLTAAMAGSNTVLHLRNVYGSDGSDQLATLSYAAASLEKLAAVDDRVSREIALGFVAAQSCLAYGTSGAAKLVSSTWRDGTAILHIFRCVTYGDRTLYELCRHRPWLARVLAWSVIVGELAFPLVLVAPQRLRPLFFGAGAAFHVANAKFMGLNRFFWSFVGSYPAVAHVAGRRWRSASPVPVERSVARGHRLSGLLAIAGFGAWLGVSVLQQLNRRDPWSKRLDPSSVFVPEWKFFAPTPVRHDYNLLYRVEADHGEPSPWREIGIIEPRRTGHLVWHPGRREEKALFDAANELFRTAQRTENRDQVRLTVPYLTLLNYVTNRAEGVKSGDRVQFLLATSASHEPDVRPEAVYVSSFHRI